jgi:hypothetical protein
VPAPNNEIAFAATWSSTVPLGSPRDRQVPSVNSSMRSREFRIVFRWPNSNAPLSLTVTPVGVANQVVSVSISVSLSWVPDRGPVTGPRPSAATRRPISAVSGCWGWKSEKEDGSREKSALRQLLGLCATTVRRRTQSKGIRSVGPTLAVHELVTHTSSGTSTTPDSEILGGVWCDQLNARFGRTLSGQRLDLEGHDGLDGGTVREWGTVC